MPMPAEFSATLMRNSNSSVDAGGSDALAQGRTVKLTDLFCSASYEASVA